MALTRHALLHDPLPESELARWRGVPTSAAADAMNRSQAMVGAIKPLKPGLRLCGEARTVQAMVGDNGPLHAAVSLARRGEVLVVDACACEDTAVWGEIIATAAMARGIAGIVLDGATRDAARIRELGFPVFCRAIVPRGPHKGFGGALDGPISAGGVPVSSGDLVLGDDDGVVVVPRARLAEVAAAVAAVLEREKQLIEGIAGGRSTTELLGITVPAQT